MYKIINMMESKGYDVISVKDNKSYVAYIFFNNTLFKVGIRLFDDWENCLLATYNKLYEIYGK